MLVIFIYSTIYEDNPFDNILITSNHHFKFYLFAIQCFSNNNPATSSTVLKDAPRPRLKYNYKKKENH